MLVDDPAVSRRHALLHVGDELAIEDLGSNNGTFVRGRRLPKGERTPLDPGEMVDIGPAMLVVQGGVAKRAGVAPSSPPLASGVDGMVVHDPAMQRLLLLLGRVARGNISVLLLGETGVGKERFAHLLHKQSARADKIFVGLNCAALPEPLLESELFGHEKGAFTGAVQTKQGMFETADGGTLFLDEVGELPAQIQAKLLRVLENHEVQRLGSLKPKRVDVRIISATNRDLEVAAAAREFRSDLYFRLNGVSVQIPPLRERPSEIAPLAEFFINEAVRERRPRLSPEASAALQAYEWPGNVRELRNVIERACLLCDEGIIQAEQLDLRAARTVPAQASLAGKSAPPVAEPRQGAFTQADLQRGEQELQAQRDELERQRIRQALEQCGGNQSRAAKVLGISRRTLVDRLRILGLPRPRSSKE